MTAAPGNTGQVRHLSWQTGEGSNQTTCYGLTTGDTDDPDCPVLRLNNFGWQSLGSLGTWERLISAPQHVGADVLQVAADIVTNPHNAKKTHGGGYTRVRRTKWTMASKPATAAVFGASDQCAGFKWPPLADPAALLWQTDCRPFRAGFFRLEVLSARAADVVREARWRALGCTTRRPVVNFTEAQWMVVKSHLEAQGLVPPNLDQVLTTYMQPPVTPAGGAASAGGNAPVVQTNVSTVSQLGAQEEQQQQDDAAGGGMGPLLFGAPAQQQQQEQPQQQQQPQRKSKDRHRRRKWMVVTSLLEAQDVVQPNLDKVLTAMEPPVTPAGAAAGPGDNVPVVQTSISTVSQLGAQEQQQQQKQSQSPEQQQQDNAAGGGMGPILFGAPAQQQEQQQQQQQQQHIPQNMQDEQQAQMPLGDVPQDNGTTAPQAIPATDLLPGQPGDAQLQQPQRKFKPRHKRRKSTQTS